MVIKAIPINLWIKFVYHIFYIFPIFYTKMGYFSLIQSSRGCCIFMPL